MFYQDMDREKGESRRKGLLKHVSRENGKVADKTDQVLGCPLPISSITPVLPIAIIWTDIV